MKYIFVFLIVSIACNSSKQKESGFSFRDNDFPVIIRDEHSDSALFQIQDSTIPLVDSEVHSRQFYVSSNRGHAERVKGGKWTVFGDCGTLLEVMLKENIRIQKERDSIQKLLNYYQRL